MRQQDLNLIASAVCWLPYSPWYRTTKGAFYAKCNVSAKRTAIKTRKITMQSSIQGTLQASGMWENKLSAFLLLFLVDEDTVKTINSFKLGRLLQHRTTLIQWTTFLHIEIINAKPKLLLVLTETKEWFSENALAQKFSTVINLIFEGLNDFLNFLPGSVITPRIYFFSQFHQSLFPCFHNFKKRSWSLACSN